MRLFVILLLTAVMFAIATRPCVAQTGCVDDVQCDDGDLCDGIERCVGGTCSAGAPLVCDDGDACTIDFCDPAAGCGHHDTACPTSCGPGSDGARCSDGSACTTGDVCDGGVCVGTPLACDDGDPCTTDSCDTALGCVYREEPHPPTCVTAGDCLTAADHVPCVGDGDPCTQDGCLLGTCQVGLRQFRRQCADGNACNGDEFCSRIKGCQPGPPPICDDGDPCSGTESCDPALGCVAGTPEPDGTACDDALVCTGSDHCDAARCTGTPRACDDGDAATTDLCTEATDCLHCTQLADAHLTLAFATDTRDGRFDARGRFVPVVPFDPAAAAGATLLVHDGRLVIHASHVPGTAFTGHGNVRRFADRSGTIAAGLTRLRVRAGSAATATFSARGFVDSGPLGGDVANDVTIVAGPSCATATIACTVTRDGRVRRCK